MGMLAFMLQTEGGRVHLPHGGMLEPILLLVFGAVVGMLVVAVTHVLVRSSRTTFRSWRTGRRRRRAATNAEERARAQMSELCPWGWRAQITLLEGAALGDAPVRGGQRMRVALDWAELRDDSGRMAVMRRVWGSTIADALDAMVADRRTDETLEQIEQVAALDGALWPDL